MLHKTIKKVTEDIESFKFNTAVSALMIFSNECLKSDISKDDYKKFLQLLAPFAPHMTEELWQNLGETESIHLASWPTYDSDKIVDEEVTIGVQVNGKLRAEVVVSKDESKESMETAALALPKIKEYIQGKSIQKVIVVPGRIINIVISE